MKVNLKRVLSMILVLASVLSIMICFPMNEVSAAKGYYAYYNDVAAVNPDKSTNIMQALGVGSTYMYVVHKDWKDSKAIMTKTDKNTGKTVVLTDSVSGSRYVNYLQHANDMTLKTLSGKTNMFIATMGANDHGLVRIEVDGNKFTKKGNYTLKYNGNVVGMAGVEQMNFTSTHINFLFKRGLNFYRGSLPINATGGTINLAFAFSIDVKNVTVNGTNTDLSSYTHQGFGYHNGNIYVPVTKGNRSYIIVYNIKGASGTVKADKELSFRITSQAYSKLFEIESCDIGSDGKLYFNTNRQAADSDSLYNGIHYIRDFKYSGQSSYNVTASHKAQLEELLFDATVYAESNRDVKNAYGNNAAKLKQHWYEYGIKEGRFASVFFDAKYYLKNNADVAGWYGSTNYAAAYDHFVRAGFWEGRQGSQYFNVDVYITRNLDIAKAFGAMNYLAAAKHFRDYGLNEIHRVTSMQFSMQGYYNRYSDLRNAFGKNGRSLIIHYHNNGKNEGRNCL